MQILLWLLLIPPLAATAALGLRLRGLARQARELERRIAELDGGILTGAEKPRAAVASARSALQEGRGRVSRLSLRLESTLTSTEAVRIASERITTAAVDLSESVESSASAIEELAASAQAQSGLTQRQSTALRQSSASVAGISAAARDISLALDSQHGATETLVGAVGEGSRTALATASVIDLFADKAESIAVMVSAINDIAESTNLLAMNAAIEAAHAGQFGKGFAVVADEIRKLAATSGVKAAEISALLASLGNSIQEARTAGAESARAFRSIEASVAKTAQAYSLIAERVRSLAGNAGELSSALGDIEQASREISAGAGEMAQATLTLRDNLRVSSQVAEETKRQIEAMEQRLVELSLGMLDLSECNVGIGTGIERSVTALGALRTGDPSDGIELGNLDIPTVRLRHKEWVTKVRLNLAGALELDQALAANPRKCALGKWLYEGGGLARVAEHIDAGRFEGLHNHLHSLVGKLAGDRRTLAPAELESALSALEGDSTAIVGLLGELEAGLAGRRDPNRPNPRAVAG